jgi:ABC-2 type transport system ATP-binding protein
MALAERTLLEISGATGEDDGDVRVDHSANKLTVPFAAGGRGLPEALRRLDAARLEITDLALRRPTLDDVFLTMTGRPAEQESEDETEHAA